MKIGFELLQPSLVNRDFVKNEPKCNYEHYLLELVNQSSYFREKGHSLFKPPEDESNGEYDANAKDYQIDFKLLASPSMFKLNNLYSASIQNMDAIMVFGKPKKTIREDEEVCATWIHNALAIKNLSELEEIRLESWDMGDNMLEADIAQVLKTVEKQKNLLLFFPVITLVNSDKESFNLDDTLLYQLNHDFHEMFRYREKYGLDFDTYFTLLAYDQFYIYELKDTSLRLVEKISSSLLPTFMKLK